MNEDLAQIALPWPFRHRSLLTVKAYPDRDLGDKSYSKIQLLVYHMYVGVVCPTSCPCSLITSWLNATGCPTANLIITTSSLPSSPPTLYNLLRRKYKCRPWLWAAGEKAPVSSMNPSRCYRTVPYRCLYTRPRCVE